MFLISPEDINSQSCKFPDPDTWPITKHWIENNFFQEHGSMHFGLQNVQLIFSLTCVAAVSYSCLAGQMETRLFIYIYVTTTLLSNTRLQIFLYAVFKIPFNFACACILISERTKSTYIVLIPAIYFSERAAYCYAISIPDLIIPPSLNV